MTPGRVPARQRRGPQPPPPAVADQRLPLHHTGDEPCRSRSERNADSRQFGRLGREPTRVLDTAHSVRIVGPSPLATPAGGPLLVRGERRRRARRPAPEGLTSAEL